MDLREFSLPFTAGADLSALRFTIVHLSTSADRTVVASTAGSNGVIGVLQNKPKLGQAADVMIVGVSKVIYGANVTAGDLLTATTGGKAIPAAPANNAIVYCIGRALATGVANDVGSVMLIPGITTVHA